MKNLFLHTSLLLLMLPSFFSRGYSQEFNWLRSGGGDSDDMGYYIKTDSLGNSYVTGYYRDTALFSSFPMYNNTGSYYMYLAKYDSAGTCKWVRSPGGGYGSGVAFDSKGYIYVGGRFNGKYIAKYDSLGNLCRTIPGDGWGQVQQLDVYDKYIIATGVFGNSITLGSTTLTASGSYDGFIVCYDTTGVFQWAKKYGTAYTDDSKGIAVDKNGNSYITGFTRDGGPWQVFLAKYDIAGNFQWEKKSASTTMSNEAWTVDVDKAGNIYMGGVGDDISFDGHSLSGSSSFMLKTKPDGTVCWLKRTGINAGHVRALRFNRSGNYYVTGAYYGNPVFGSTTLPNTQTNNTFIAQYDTSGACLMATYGYFSIINGNTLSQSLSFDKWNNVYVAGYFGNFTTNTYFANFGNKSVSGYGYTDMFLVKMKGVEIPPDTTLLGTGLLNSSKDNVISIYPNPNSGFINLDVHLLNSPYFEIRILDRQGALIYQEKAANFDSDYSGVINLSKEAKGIYCIQIITETEVFTDKLIIE